MSEVIAFNKRGDNVAHNEIPPVIYLKSMKEWIDDMLIKTPTLDGIVLLIDWENKKVAVHRYAED